MALRDRSLFLYGFQVTELNSSLDFQAVSLGPVLLATLRLGYYSLTELTEEIVRAMTEQDTTNTYQVTVDRTQNGGLENRVTITTLGTHLQLRFGTGPRVASSISSLIGFAATDRTGALFYTGTSTAGTALVPELVGYNYLPPAFKRKVQGAVNISASGEKEALVFQMMLFWQVEFQHEPETKITLQWVPLVDWMVQQRGIEFTPEISTPNTFFDGTLETSSADGKGLAFNFDEMLPDFPFFYKTGRMTFRQRVSGTAFI